MGLIGVASGDGAAAVRGSGAAVPGVGEVLVATFKGRVVACGRGRGMSARQRGKGRHRW